MDACQNRLNLDADFQRCIKQNGNERNKITKRAKENKLTGIVRKACFRWLQIKVSHKMQSGHKREIYHKGSPNILYMALSVALLSLIIPV